MAAGAGYALLLIAVALAGAEIFLRYLDPAPQRYFIWPPHMTRVFHPSEEATPGVSGPGRFITNSLGLRSDEPLPGRERTIHVMGGSTSIDIYLDQDEAWPQQLQDRLNRMPGQPLTWVGNLSRSSMATPHNLLMFEYLVPTLPRADMFIVLAGVNDLHLALKSGYLPEMSHELHMSWTFSHRPRGEGIWHNLALRRFIRRINDWRTKSALGPVQDADASGNVEWRRCRASAPPENLVNDLPDLNSALAEYRRNLNALVDQARNRGAQIAFLTQPTLWQEKMAPENARLLLAGGLGPNHVWCRDRRYYSPAALAGGMTRFNETMLAVCRERGAHCIDTARLVRKDSRNFYDDMHFSESGASLIAAIVAGEIARLGAGASRMSHFRLQ